VKSELRIVLPLKVWQWFARNKTVTIFHLRTSP